MKRAATTGCVAVAVVGVLVVTTAAMFMLAVSSTETAAAQTTVSRCTLAPSGGVTVGDLGSEQVGNARRIIGVGKSAGVPARGWVVAIAAAMQESTLRNLDYGDRDSLGLFQQRPSAGWGTPAQIRTPEMAIRAFYGLPRSPTANAGLLDIPGWQQMPIWEAAQTVQRSAFPYAYQAHEPLASTLVRKLADTTAGCRPIAAGPWRLPLEGVYTLTSGYGPRISPTRGTFDIHTGLDFAAPAGSPAFAVSAGRVTFVDWGGGYGNLVKIRHADGVESWYAHLSATAVAAGDSVKPGQQIGMVGITGNSTGPHLHLEVRVDGLPRDPATWLRQKGVSP